MGHFRFGHGTGKTINEFFIIFLSENKKAATPTNCRYSTKKLKLKTTEIFYTNYKLFAVFTLSTTKIWFLRRVGC